MTHDYKRNGTACLFAALNVLDGTIIGTFYPRHRREGFLKFLRKIDCESPEGMDLHLIVDNYGTHKHLNVTKSLEKHKRFYCHFSSTSRSWLNLIERWIGEITCKRIRPGVFHSVPEPTDAIEEYVRLNNQKPKPFVWTNKTGEILERTNHCNATLGALHKGRCG